MLSFAKVAISCAQTEDMTQSRTAPSHTPFHLMAKPTGFQCNIACDYCFYLEKEEGTLKSWSQKRHMDDQTIENYIRGYIEATPSSEVEFAWQGGEPTTAGLPFFERAVALQKRFSNGKAITNTIQTNGLLIDNAFAEFMAKQGFLVGLSIDGPEQIHDRYRRTRNGKGTHSLVLKALQCLKEHGVERNILCVVNSNNANQASDIYRYFTQELGEHYLQFIPAVEQRRCGLNSGELSHPQEKTAPIALTDWSVTGRAYGQFLIDVFDLWVRHDVGKVFVQFFDNALASWLKMKPSLCVMQPTCGTSLVVEMNGDVYSCDHYVFPQNRLGNLNKDALATLVGSKKQKVFGLSKLDLPKSCHACEWKFACHGGCPKHRIHSVEGKWHNHLCDGYKLAFKHMNPYLQKMSELFQKQCPPAEIMSLLPL